MVVTTVMWIAALPRGKSGRPDGTGAGHGTLGAVSTVAELIVHD
jgi:hypothetical protein